jgi:(1->4)-alpha-D-glucan 1-alpha-D-glucosylmutase
MAKGIEDTAFYQFNRLLSLNEVGGDPDRFGVPPPALHRALEQRQAKWPRAFSATATHDTKRGEDVRARLNVLSEIPAEWRDAVARWAALNAPYRITLDEQTVPDANEEYLLYQTLVGTLEVGSREYAVGSNGHAGATPVPEVTPYSAQATAYCLLPTAAYVKRIQDYMHKALHEAKVHSSWINPDPAYDDAVRQFTAAILDTEKNRPFLDDLHAFAGRVAHYGYFNSLAQALIKFTAPGVPDTYQGTELWDFSLVDPDNRRPVDFDLRARLLADLQARSESGDVRRLARELVESKEDGRVKLYLTWRALNLRREQPGLFAEGDYVPLEVDGARREHLFAFLRRRAKAWALVAVPRLLTAVIADDQAPLGGVWGDAAVRLPAEAPRQWRNVLTAERVVVSPGEALPAAELLAAFPVALLTAEA